MNNKAQFTSGPLMNDRHYYNECPQCKQLIGPTQPVRLVGKNVYHIACVIAYASHLAYENQTKCKEDGYNVP